MVNHKFQRLGILNDSDRRENALAVGISVASYLAAGRSVSDCPVGNEEKLDWAWSSLIKPVRATILGAVVLSTLSVLLFFDVSPVKELAVVNLRKQALSPRPQGWFSFDTRDSDYRLAIRRFGSERSSLREPLPLPNTDKARKIVARAKQQLNSQIESEWRKLALLIEPPLLSEQDFRNANLTGTFAVRADLSNSRFDNANLARTSLELANLSGASFQSSLLRRAQLYEANLANADFTDATIEGVNFSRAQLVAVNFSGAVILSSNFNGATLAGANFTNATFRSAADIEQAAILGQKKSSFQNTRFGKLRVTIDDQVRAVPVILAGADLINSGMTEDDLLQACGDENTKLPPGILEIRHCKDVIGIWPLPDFSFTVYSSFARDRKSTK